MRYAHTQTAPLYLIVVATAVGMSMGAWMAPEQPVQVILAASGVLMFVLAFSFQHLTISDQGDELLIRFGPLPLFQRRVQYAQIEHVEQARSTILDGWGIHLSPSGGWTWSVAGAAGRRAVRAGADVG